MKKFLVAVTMSLLAAGCSHTPTHFIVNTSPAINAQGVIIKNVRFHVSDQRSRQEIFRSTQDGQHSYLAAQSPTTSLIEQGLRDNFKMQINVGVSQSAETLVSVNIEKMALKLQQDTLTYETKSLVVFNVSITNGTKTLNKTFKRQGSSKGPLKADIAVLEQEFSQLLVTLFNDISHDPQVAQYLDL